MSLQHLIEPVRALEETFPSASPMLQVWAAEGII